MERRLLWLEQQQQPQQPSGLQTDQSSRHSDNCLTLIFSSSGSNYSSCSRGNNKKIQSKARFHASTSSHLTASLHTSCYFTLYATEAQILILLNTSDRYLLNIKLKCCFSLTTFLTSRNDVNTPLSDTMATSKHIGLVSENYRMFFFFFLFKIWDVILCWWCSNKCQ